MKFVLLATTAMINGLPRGPNDGQQLVTNAQADHLEQMGLLADDGIEDAPGYHDPADRAELDAGTADQKAVEKAVKAQLKKLRADDETKLKDALAAQAKAGEEALDAEITRIREDGEKALAAAMQEQAEAQEAIFDESVAAAAAKLTEPADPG